MLTNQKSRLVHIGIFFLTGKRVCRKDYWKNHVLMPFYINIASLFWIDLAVSSHLQENVPAIPLCLFLAASSVMWAAGACDSQHPLVPWPELDRTSLAVHVRASGFAAWLRLYLWWAESLYLSGLFFFKISGLDQINAESLPALAVDSVFIFLWLLLHVGCEGSHRS